MILAECSDTLDRQVNVSVIKSRAHILTLVHTAHIAVCIGILRMAKYIGPLGKHQRYAVYIGIICTDGEKLSMNKGLLMCSQISHSS